MNTNRTGTSTGNRGIIMAMHPRRHPFPVWQGIWVAFCGKNGTVSDLLRRVYPHEEAAQALIGAGSIMALEEPPHKNLGYTQYFPPILGITPEKLIQIMNAHGDCAYAFIWDGTNWQTRDIASQWTF